MNTPPTTILVVGAGPAGLTLGIELLRRGVPCRVVDRGSGPTPTSRAFTLHARTLELFEQAGFVERFLSLGVRNLSMDYRFQGTDEIARIDFGEIEGRYPYTLIVNQNVTEQVLRERFTELGGVIEWNVELTGLEAGEAGGVRAALAHMDDGGREEIVEPGYLVGCDGVRSTVRARLGLDFEGDEYTGMEMKMMDVPVSGFPLPEERLHYFITRDRLILFCKLPGPNWRVLISDMPKSGTRTEAARPAFQSALDEQFHGAVQLGEPEWATAFRIWKRVVTKYRHGDVLLAGDAAHVHSPAGGQGMNACIQDAFNLGWKLALVASGAAHGSLLDSYELERRPIAQQLVEGTNALHAVIMAHGMSLEDRIGLTRAPGWNRSTVAKVSGLSYTYRDVVELPAGVSPLDGPRAGDRSPDASIGAEGRVHELLRHPGHTALLFAEGAAARTELEAALARFGEHVAVRVVPVGQGCDAHRVYGTEGIDSVTLVRPDGHIAHRCRLAERDTLVDALQRVLV